MKNSSKQKQEDPLLVRYQLQWDETDDLREQTRILKRMLTYVKKRYGTGSAEFGANLCNKASSIEDNLCTLFDFASGVIADVRRSTKQAGKQYGIGLHEKPTGDELAEIRTFTGPQGVRSVESFEDIDPELDPDDDVSDELKSGTETDPAANGDGGDV